MSELFNKLLSNFKQRNLSTTCWKNCGADEAIYVDGRVFVELNEKKFDLGMPLLTLSLPGFFQCYTHQFRGILDIGFPHNAGTLVCHCIGTDIKLFSDLFAAQTFRQTL